jgi:hypothetical protein
VLRTDLGYLGRWGAVTGQLDWPVVAPTTQGGERSHESASTGGMDGMTRIVRTDGENRTTWSSGGHSFSRSTRMT